MSNERESNNLPIPEFGNAQNLSTDFIQAVRSIRENREKIESNTTEPQIMRAMLETSWNRTATLYFFLKNKRDKIIAEQDLKTAWQVVDDLFSEGLELAQPFKDSSPNEISDAINKVDETSEARVASRNILLGTIRQQMQDGEISNQKAVEITRKLAEDTIAETHEYIVDTSNTKISPPVIDADLMSFYIQALDLVSIEDGPETGDVKQISLLYIDFLSQRQAIKTNWYIMDEEDEKLAGIQAKEAVLAIDKQLNFIGWCSEYSEHLIDDYVYFESLGRTIQTYGRLTHVAYSKGEMTKEEFLQATNRLIQTTWKVATQKYEESDSVKDGYHTLVIRSGSMINAHPHLPPWNSNQLKLFKDLIKINEDKNYSLTLFGFVGFLGQMGWIDHGTFEELRKHVFHKNSSEETGHSKALTVR